MNSTAEIAVEQKTGRARLQVVAETAVIAVCCLAFLLTALFFCVTLLTGKTAGTRDFVVYWATGQQFVHGHNPYDKAALGALERPAGLPSQYGVMYMRNPPWTLPITLPLGFFSVKTASLLWSLLLLGCLALSLHLLWAMYGRPANRLHLFGYTFAPAILCLMFGQTSLFALLGLVLFLRLHRTRPFWAGVALWLCALKPHLFVPFGLVLLVWAVMTRSYRLLAGAVASVLASCFVVYLIDPLAWPQYTGMMRASGVVREFIPCMSVMVRLWVYPHTVWLEYLPTGLGCIWALWYFRKHRAEWDWMDHGSLLMLVSVLVAPYAWPFDQSVGIPALLRGASRTRSRGLLAALALASALVEMAIYADIWFPLALYKWTLWTAPAWLAWYLLACRKAGDPGPAQHSLLQTS